MNALIAKALRAANIANHLMRGKFTNDLNALDTALAVHGTYLFINGSDRDYPFFMMFAVPGHCCGCEDC